MTNVIFREGPLHLVHFFWMLVEEEWVVLQIPQVTAYHLLLSTLQKKVFFFFFLGLLFVISLLCQCSSRIFLILMCLSIEADQSLYVCTSTVDLIIFIPQTKYLPIFSSIFLTFLEVKKLQSHLDLLREEYTKLQKKECDPINASASGWVSDLRNTVESLYNNDKYR